VPEELAAASTGRQLVAAFGGVRRCCSSLRATSRELITAPERQLVGVQEEARRSSRKDSRLLR
jgi:hypothetical protein